MEIISKNFIDREYSNIIKGIALILMFIHHFFTFPDTFLIKNLNIPDLRCFAEVFNEPTKICVSIFAFITGYFYFFTKSKSFRYSLKKASDLYVNYLVVFVLLFLFALLSGSCDFNIKDVILEVLMLNRPIMLFCWYVPFYILSIFILPLYSKLSKKSSVLAIFIGIIFPFIFIAFLGKVESVFSVGYLKYVFHTISCVKWFPCVASGYLFAQEELFFKLDICYSKYRIIRCIVYFVFTIIPFFARAKNAEFDFIFAPLFVFGLVKLLQLLPGVRLLYPISLIGKYSLLMWFLHCTFFNVSKEFTQPILYYPYNPILVLLWGLVLILAVSFVISFPINAINRIKNELLKL